MEKTKELLFTEEVKKRINLLGLKKQHVANKIGITNVYLSYLLNNERDMSEEITLKLKAYLGL